MVLPYLKAGGTERQAGYIANYLQEKGHTVTVVCLENLNTFEEFFRVPVIHLNSGSTPARLFTNLFLLNKQLKKLNADLIISRAWNANLLCSMASALTGIPAVLFLSGSIDLSGSSFWKRTVQSFMLNKAAKIISVSNESKSNCVRWLQIPEEKIRVIHNGVDLEMAAELSAESIDLPEKLSQNGPVAVFAGRLIPRKGLDLLLDALSGVQSSGIDLKLLVVGDGEDREKYEQMAQRLNLESSVFFVGEKKNPFPYIKYGDIFVLPSRSEGFPNVLLEAMVLGKPVVAADCDTGPREIINGKNGTLVPAENIEMLAEALMTYLNNIELQNLHAKNAFTTIQEKFNLDSQLQKIESELIDTLGYK